VERTPRNDRSAEPADRQGGAAVHSSTFIRARQVRQRQGSARQSPILLNVFGSWRLTCQYEHPILTGQIKPLGITLVGLDWKDEPDDAKRWIEQFGNPYDVLITDRDGRAGIDFGVYMAPETFLVDAEGVVRYKRIGMFTKQNIRDELLPKIAELTAPVKKATP
jgi:DsbE subfamily thiol:disulfide oxidoreductase